MREPRCRWCRGTGQVSAELARTHDEDRRQRLTSQFHTFQDQVRAFIDLLRVHGTELARLQARRGEDLLVRVETSRTLPAGHPSRSQDVRDMVAFMSEALAVLKGNR
jgi:hypothetical protein